MSDVGHRFKQIHDRLRATLVNPPQSVIATQNQGTCNQKKAANQLSEYGFDFQFNSMSRTETTLQPDPLPSQWYSTCKKHLNSRLLKLSPCLLQLIFVPKYTVLTTIRSVLYLCHRQSIGRQVGNRRYIPCQEARQDMTQQRSLRKCC